MGLAIEQEIQVPVVVVHTLGQKSFVDSGALDVGHYSAPCGI